MIEALGILSGAISGCALSFVPGLHVALVLTLLFTSGVLKPLGPTGVPCFLAGAAGALVYARRLGTVYHPTASSESAASLDPALRLTQAGRGRECLRLMVFGADVAWIPVAIGLLVVTLGEATGVNLAKEAAEAFRVITVPAIGLWALYTVLRSRHKGMTLTGLLLTGVAGYVVLHHPVLVGNEYQLAPLMTGLFAVPIMTQVLKERGAEVPAQLPWNGRLEGDPTKAVVGAFVGTLSGFFAGLGAGSLIGLLSGWCKDDDADYLLLSAAGEAADDILALVLVLVAGTGRSGEAVILGQAAQRPGLPQALALIGAIAFGAWVGRKFVLKAEGSYLRFLTCLPPAFWGLLVIALGLVQVVATGHPLLGLGLTASAALIGLWSRQCRLPLQTAFAALALPLVAAHLGLVPVLNGVLFT